MKGSATAPDYVIRVHEDPSEIDAALWDDLLGMQPQPTPFMRSAYLRALHHSQSATAATGWQPRYLSVWDGGSLVAACPLYLKFHSYGEYVFDWAWAQAHERHGLQYYPKLLCAVPFTPVPGSRLLARDEAARDLLAEAMVGMAREMGVSSLHVLFTDPADERSLRAAGCLIRQGVQFHWTQDPMPGPADFDGLLARMHRDKRKKIQQEQRRVRDAGVCFSVHEGCQVDEALWDFFYACYCRTYRDHHSTPYLSRSFFSSMRAEMPDNWVLFQAHRCEQPIACSLVGIDPQRRHAYGRYWGALEEVPCLHFDACYYQPLTWCLANGYRRFEGGAQGEHKMARGLLPAPTRSAHWMADQRFAGAVDDFLRREGVQVDAYREELQSHSPFKADP